MSLNEQRSLLGNLMEMCGQEKQFSNNSSSQNCVGVSRYNDPQLLLHKIDGVAVIVYFFVFIK